MKRSSPTPTPSTFYGLIDSLAKIWVLLLSTCRSPSSIPVSPSPDFSPLWESLYVGAQNRFSELGSKNVWGLRIHEFVIQINIIALNAQKELTRVENFGSFFAKWCWEFIELTFRIGTTWILGFTAGIDESTEMPITMAAHIHLVAEKPDDRKSYVWVRILETKRVTKSLLCYYCCR